MAPGGAPTCADVLLGQGFADPATATVHEIDLRADADAARQARLFASSVALPLDADAMATLGLLTSELVTNAVLHAGTHITYGIAITDTRVVVAVGDESPLAAVRNVTGRGLQLVEVLSAQWGVQLGARVGKAVWFTLHRRS